MLMNDMHQRSYLLSFEISWLIGFCNQWALLDFYVIFQYFSEWGFSMWFKIYWNTFFAKCSCVVLVCLIPAPILFAMKQKKVRFFVYLGNRQIIGAVLSCHAFKLITPNTVCCTENAVFCFLNTLSGIKNVVFNSNFIISYSLGLKWVSRHWLRQMPGYSQHWLTHAWDY